MPLTIYMVTISLEDSNATNVFNYTITWKIIKLSLVAHNFVICNGLDYKVTCTIIGYNFTWNVHDYEMTCSIPCIAPDGTATIAT